MESIYHADYWPFAILLSSIALVVALVSRLRFHPFVALVLAAVFVGLMTPNLMENKGIVAALDEPMIAFGVMAGKIAWVIALAAIIGTAMLESGAAEKIVTQLLNKLGEKQAALALLIAAFLLSIPVFLDTVFFLLIPLGISLALKTGKNYILYVIAIGGGAAITHSIVPPTPGPLIMAESLGIELGTVILSGMILGIIPAILVLFIGKRINEKMDVPIRIALPENTGDASEISLTWALAPIVLPILMIGSGTMVQAITGHVPEWLVFLGNKNLAMAAGAGAALYLWAKSEKMASRELWTKVGKPLEIGGIIILITSAGGAYGAMINNSGIGEAIRLATENFPLHFIPLAWLIAAVLKTAQGSGTVAMISSVAIMSALIGDGQSLGFHPVYLLMAMGFGSLFISWMNDSAFWVVARMSGLTEKEALKTWTFLLACISLVGMAQVWLLSYIFPFV
ncbi:GntP family permease [Cyclobacterium amurskyense]|uniref:Gluconate permease n=1 Tax=Cyclobacterium amurskyense TaxID=320787 RepID=A0A0H4PB04_9BACT|nr:SLC13 family permease [Cyclobacterium amurskyense]AKP51616.1 Gluconate permease [Cyclobacterium amurskyense]|tara:strand:+ start:12644 stop:14005 length:1362 start_codon:yes stop_codon:yes gene_type:complete